MEGAELFDKALPIFERIAVANEKLIELAVEERDIGDSASSPFFCPHCRTPFPAIRNEGGDGSSREYVLVAVCGNCQEVIYAVPQGWLCYPKPSMAQEEIERRKGGST